MMETQKTIHLVFKVVRQSNKTKYDTYSRQNVPEFQSVNEMREFLLSNFADALSPADKADAFQLGYIAGKNRRVVIGYDINLAEAYSLMKDGWITLWADPDVLPTATARSSKRTYSESLSTNSRENDSSSSANYDKVLENLKTKHGSDVAEFKLRVWAKMLNNGTHNSTDMPPKIPFFTGAKSQTKRTHSLVSTTSAVAMTVTQMQATTSERRLQVNNMEEKIRLRSVILQQLKDLKSLKEAEVLTSDQFEEQKGKLLHDMSNL